MQILTHLSKIYWLNFHCGYIPISGDETKKTLRNQKAQVKWKLLKAPARVLMNSYVSQQLYGEEVWRGVRETTNALAIMLRKPLSPVMLRKPLSTIHSIRCVYVHMSNLAVYTNRSARVNPALPFYHTQHFTHLVQPVTLHTRHNTKEPEHLLQREAVHVETALQVSRTLRTTSLDAHADD